MHSAFRLRCGRGRLCFPEVLSAQVLLHATKAELVAHRPPLAFLAYVMMACTHYGQDSPLQPFFSYIIRYSVYVLYSSDQFSSTVDAKPA